RHGDLLSDARCLLQCALHRHVLAGCGAPSPRLPRTVGIALRRHTRDSARRRMRLRRFGVVRKLHKDLREVPMAIPTRAPLALLARGLGCGAAPHPARAGGGSGSEQNLHPPTPPAMLADPFAMLPTGSAQLDTVCGRGGSDGVTTRLCTTPRPVIHNLADL